MGSIGRYQVYYERIYTDVLVIKEEQGYSNLSKAFAHWYFEKFEKLSAQEIAEAIIDGMGDNGIDAIILSGGNMRLYQFKFPDKVSNIDKAIDEKAALKIQNGYKKLTSERKPRIANERFMSFWQDIKEHSIFCYKYIFVSYSEGLSKPAEDSLAFHIDDIKNTTGNEIQLDFITKKRICDLVDKSQKRSAVDINLKYVRLDPSYNLDNEGNAWSGFANAKEVLGACKPVLDVIFDENIRLYEGNVPVNEGIKRTAGGSDSKYFYFFHNGIVFICDNCQNSTGNQTVKLSAASVVNGCQTIVSLNMVSESNNLQEDVFLPIRIIETDDFDLRAKITEYLNSQSKIKDSYFLANNTFIKELQEQLLIKGYFLERLSNEYSYKLALGKVGEFPKEKILPLEKIIQIFVAFYNNDYAATAKRGKNDLFNRDLIDTLISSISAERVLNAYNNYNKVCEKITLYRRCRRIRSSMSKEFLQFLKYDDMPSDKCDELMEQYGFMNTADLLLLNAYHNLKKNPKATNNDENIIRIAIEICWEVIKKSRALPSAATKNASIFKEVQEKCSKRNSFV